PRLEMHVRRGPVRRQRRHRVVALEEGVDLRSGGVGVSRLPHRPQGPAQLPDPVQVLGSRRWEVAAPHPGRLVEEAVEGGEVRGALRPGPGVGYRHRQPDGIAGVIGEIHLIDYSSPGSVTSIGYDADYATGGVRR